MKEEAGKLETIEIRFLGNPEIRRNGTRVSFPYRKAEAFFYYLAYRQRASREELIHLLWGDEEESTGRKKLRDAVYQVRRQLGSEVLTSQGNAELALSAEVRLSTDLSRYDAPFLEHFFVKNCYEFEEWAEGVRSERQRQDSAVARQQYEAAYQEEDVAGMQRAAKVLLAEDPFNEALYLELMQRYAACGQHHMALRLYRDMEKLFREELETAPSREATQLFQQIFTMKEQLPPVEEKSGGPGYIGREKELLEISGFLQAGSTKSVALIEGEEGCGKTGFLDACRKLAEGNGMLALHAICYRQGAEFFLSPFGDIFEELRQLAAEGKLGDISEEETALTIAELAGGVEEEGSGYLRYQAVEQRLLGLLQSLCRKKRVLITIDEIQWMDEVSYRLLLKLLQSLDATQLRLICTYQGQEEAKVVRQLERPVREDRVRFLALKPFSRAESDRIVLRVFPEFREAPERLAALYEMTEGNAFFLQEMIALIREKGFVLRKTPKIDRLIAARFSGLTGAEREVLSCMAIFPEKINMEELEYLLPHMNRLELLGYLESLEGNRLIQELTVGFEVCYKFVHRVFREYLYEQQSAGRTRLYHRMLAEYYERTQGGRYAALPVIAHHWMHALCPVKAYGYQIRYLQEFYTILNENFPIVHSEITDLGGQFGALAEAEKMLELAKEVIRLEDNSPEVSRMKMQMLYILGRHDIAAGHYDSGVAAIEQCMMAARRCADSDMLFSCYLQHIFHSIQTSNLEKAERYTALGLKESAEGHAEMHAAFQRLWGWCLLRRGQFEAANTALREARSAFEALEAEQAEKSPKYRASIAACIAYCGDIARLQGKLEAALAAYRDAATIGGVSGETNGMAQIYSGIGQLLYLLGRDAESGEYLTRAAGILTASGYRWGLERTEGYLALLAIRQRQTVAAAEHLKKARYIAERIRNPETEELLREAEAALMRQEGAARTMRGKS